MTDYSRTFGVQRVERSTCFSKPSEKQTHDSGCDYCNPKVDKRKSDSIPFPQSIRKIVTNVSVACHNETGKWWQIQDCLVWNEQALCWEESCEGIRELPAIYKAGASLPSFNGVLSVYTPRGSEEVSGGEETPEDMIGGIFCVGGELCYFGDAPAPSAEVQLEGDEPEADSGVKLWVDCGIAKYPGENPGEWVQLIPYGETS